MDHGGRNTDLKGAFRTVVNKSLYLDGDYCRNSSWDYFLPGSFCKDIKTAYDKDYIDQH